MESESRQLGVRDRTSTQTVDGESITSDQEFVLEASRSSVLPSAEEVRRYEKLAPGAADRILRMAEQEGEHRREMERRQLENNQTFDLRRLEVTGDDMRRGRSEVRWGQVGGLIIGLSIVGTAAYVAHLGHPGYASTIVTTVLIGVVGLFLRQQSSDPPKVENAEDEHDPLRADADGNPRD